jgi:hypothetical protein
MAKQAAWALVPPACVSRRVTDLEGCSTRGASDGDPMETSEKAEDPGKFPGNFRQVAAESLATLLRNVVHRLGGLRCGTDHHVSFRWKDYREHGCHKTKVMHLG